MKNKTTHPNWMTTRKERISYMFGMGSIYGQYNLVGACLTAFLMMSGMDMTLVASILLVMKGIDAFDDLMVGFFVDKLDPKKNKRLAKIAGEGRYMPWMRLVTFTLPFFAALLYLMPTQGSQALKVVWFAFFYLAVDISYSLVDVPGNAMITTLTNSLEERNSILGNKIFPMALFALVGSVLPTVLFSEYVGVPMGLTVAFVIVLMSLITIPLVRNVKEHNLEETDAQEENEYSLREMWKYLKSNKYMMIYYSSLIIRLITVTGSGLSLFVCYYFFHSTLFSLIYTACALVPMVVIAVLTPHILKKIDSGKLFLWVSVFGVFSGLALYLIGYSSPAAHLAIYFINVIPATFMTVAASFLCPNIVEYGKYKSDVDGTGVAFAINTFSIKLGGAVAGSLGLFILSFFGWVNVEASSFAELAAQNVQQTAEALNGLWIVNALVPVIGATVATVILFFYKLRDKDVAVMVRYNNGEITREEAESLMSKKY